MVKLVQTANPVQMVSPVQTANRAKMVNLVKMVCTMYLIRKPDALTYGKITNSLNRQISVGRLHLKEVLVQSLMVMC